MTPPKLTDPEFQPPPEAEIPEYKPDPFGLGPEPTAEQSLVITRHAVSNTDAEPPDRAPVGLTTSDGKLTLEEYQLLRYIEQCFQRNSTIPSYQQLTKEGIELSNGEDTYWEAWSNTRFVRALAGRGIPEWVLAKQTKQGTVFDGKLLTEKQLHVANIMLDTLDKRSKIKKLTEAGVTTKQYSQWLRDPVYRRYTLERSEAILQESQPTAHLALVERVTQGDLGAIKYYNSMVGRYRERAGSGAGGAGVEINIQQNNTTLNDMAYKIIQAIQRHVKDPETLRAIGNDIMALASGNASSSDAVTTPLSGSEITAGRDSIIDGMAI